MQRKKKKKNKTEAAAAGNEICKIYSNGGCSKDLPSKVLFSLPSIFIAILLQKSDIHKIIL
jgi:hypothetical protein